LEKIGDYWKEIIAAGIVPIGIALLFYYLLEEGALSIAVGIILAGFTFQAILIKLSVENALKRNLELYNLQSSIKDPIFKTKAQKIIDLCLKDLRNLSLGTYEVYGAQPAYEELEEFYMRAQTNDVIKSVVIYDNNIILDRSYLEHHREAIKRGAIIIKIFIVPDEATNGYHNKILSFEEIGVKTNIVRRKTIGPDSRLIADFLLYQNIVAISTPDNDGMLRSLKITTQRHDFEDYTRKFDGLRKIAYPISDEKNNKNR
jgi:hypothetical protein